RSFPCPNGLRIVHRDGTILDDSATPLGHLPFEGVTGQSLRGGALPDKTPEVRLSLGTLGGLNASGRFLKFLPGFRWSTVTIFPQKIGSIIQETCIQIVWQRHQPAMHSEIGDCPWEMVGNLLGRHVGLEIEELVSENGRPDH